MDERTRVLLAGAVERANHLSYLLSEIIRGNAIAAAELQAECRQLPYEGAVWCLPCDQFLEALGLGEAEGCDLGAGPQPAA